LKTPSAASEDDSWQLFCFESGVGVVLVANLRLFAAVHAVFALPALLCFQVASCSVGLPSLCCVLL